MHRAANERRLEFADVADGWNKLTSAVGGVFKEVAPTVQDKAQEPQATTVIVVTTVTPGADEPILRASSDATPDPTPTPESANDFLLPTKVAQLADASIPTAIEATTTLRDVGDELAKDTSRPTPTSASEVLLPTNIVSHTPTPTPTAQKAEQGDGGDIAVKAGIVIGILGGIFVVFVLAWLIVRRRSKKQEQRKQQMDDDEKLHGSLGGNGLVERSVSTKTSATAPRLSLRPVTQFLPNLNPHPHPDRRTSRGAVIALQPSPQMSRSHGTSAWERPSTANSSNYSNHPDNPFADPSQRPRVDPFGDHAQRPRTPAGRDNFQPRPVSPLSDDGMQVGTAITTNSPPRSSPMNSNPAAGLTRKTSIRQNAPQALDLTIPPPLDTIPPSPAGTEFSFTSVAPGQSPGFSSSAAAIAAAGGPSSSAVHRVQLDFKPTLEDEMGLRAGQLVRMLHEYDDGWALCIRLDRSQQGVVPRTCLSTRPVKPRPANGGPRGPPVNPSGHYGRGPAHPQANRPMTPQGGPVHRPMSPAGQNGPRYHQGRPQSPNGSARRMSPPGSSHMNQEYRPGPGQAY